MARPKKNNAEYFSHDADMRNDVRIKALRRKFSHKGYAVWCFLLETLTDADFFTLEWDEINIELLAADYEVEVKELNEIVEYCLKIDLLQKDGSKIYSVAHQNRFAPLLANRDRKRSSNGQSTPSREPSSSLEQPRSEPTPEAGAEPLADYAPQEGGSPQDNLGGGRSQSLAETILLDSNGGVSASQNSAETPTTSPNGEPKSHSKVKESKVKESKKDIAHTVFLRKGGVGEKQSAADLLAWIEATFPAVHAMAEPLNDYHAAAILAKFSDEDINRIIAAIDNKGATRNKSAYATFNAFVSRDTIIKERNNVRSYTYGEMCDMITSRGYNWGDFEARENGGVKYWIRKIDIIRAQV